MADDVCGHENPANTALTCDKSPHPFGGHMHRESMAVWPGLAMPERRTKGGPKGERVKGVVRAIEESGNAIATGPPGPHRQQAMSQIERSWRQTQDEWLRLAREALREVCEHNETFTNELVWANVDDIKQRRAMVLVIRYGLKAGWMHEDHAVRVTGTWRTRDGAEFPLNKLVPVYRSDIYS